MKQIEDKPKLDDLKTAKELLYFGLDYLVLSIGNYISPNQGKLLKFIKTIFDMPHNCENTNMIDNFVWGDTTVEFKIIFSEGLEGEIAQFFYQGEYIFRIAKVTNENWIKDINYDYKYRVIFYGMFFALARQKKIDPADIFGIFLEDIQNKVIPSSVARIDICSDVSGISVNKVDGGIRGSKEHMKTRTKINENMKTGEIETIYRGVKGKSKWFARIYNKLKDCLVKGKATFYLDYFSYEKVTRIEFELESDVCHKYKVDFMRCLDKEYLWKIYKQLAYNHVSKWRIIPFIGKSLKKIGFKDVVLERRTNTPLTLEKHQYWKRILTQIQTFERRYAEKDIIVKLIGDILLTRIKSNQNLLENKNNSLQ